MIAKIPNAPLKALNQQKLLSVINDHVRMMLCGNFDKFFPNADSQQVEMNVHTAQVAARAVAERAIELVGKNRTPNVGSELQHPPKLRDLGFVLSISARTSVLTVSAPDGWKNLEIGENLSFITAVAGCADRILIDMLIEKR